MGMFSWITTNTERSIAAVDSPRGTFKVLMLDDKGNVWTESEYDGYGIFGGKDFYQLMAEMNVPEQCTGDVDEDRMIGIDLYFGSGEAKCPTLLEASEVTIDLEDKAAVIRLWEIMGRPEDCPNQGWFYDDEDEDDDYYDDEDEDYYGEEVEEDIDGEW